MIVSSVSMLNSILENEVTFSACSFMGKVERMGKLLCLYSENLSDWPCNRAILWPYNESVYQQVKGELFSFYGRLKRRVVLDTLLPLSEESQQILREDGFKPFQEHDILYLQVSPLRYSGVDSYNVERLRIEDAQGIVDLLYDGFYSEYFDGGCRAVLHQRIRHTIINHHDVMSYWGIRQGKGLAAMMAACNYSNLIGQYLLITAKNAPFGTTGKLLLGFRHLNLQGEFQSCGYSVKDSLITTIYRGFGAKVITQRRLWLR